MTARDTDLVSKVPAVTLGFWIIKILATTLGETGGDTLSMSLNWGYLAASGLFGAILIVLVWRQIAAKQFHPFLYWATIIASTTAGTTMADFATRSLGIGYAGGSALLLVLVLLSLFAWHRTLGSISVETVSIGVQTGPLLGRDRRANGTPFRRGDDGGIRTMLGGACRARGGGRA